MLRSLFYAISECSDDAICSVSLQIYRKVRAISELDNCRAQISKMQALLDNETLDNVRDKYLRSLAAWEMRLETIERTAAARAKAADAH